MIFIAIAGPSGSGKTTLCNFFRDKGIDVYELDKIAKEFYPDVAPKVAEKFGKEVMNADGSINTKLLGKVVFADRAKMDELNQIMVPVIWEDFMLQFFIHNDFNEKIIVFDIPILYETIWWMGMNYVLFVDAEKDVRIQRLIEGRKIDPQIAEIQAGVFNYDKVKLRPWDVKIDTTHGFKDIEKLKLWFEAIQKPEYADDENERYTGWSNLAL